MFNKYFGQNFDWSQQQDLIVKLTAMLNRMISLKVVMFAVTMFTTIIEVSL